MPVQFVCSHCHRTLSVAQRKAGATVSCPKCGQPTLVPPPAAAPAAEPLAAEPASSSPPEAVSAPTSEVGAFDDVVGLIAQTPVETMAPAVVPAPPPLPGMPIVEESVASLIAPSVAPRSTAPRRARHQEGAVLLVTRQAVYAQAGLVAGLVLLAFLAGWLIGRGNRPAAKPSPAASAEPVALEGHVLYSLSPGESLPDAGATVIALPADKRPDRKIAVDGLRPDEEDDLDAAPAADALRSLGGAVTRSDGEGQFQLVVLRPGDYSLLVISHRANRPRKLAIKAADRKELGRYFASPEELIGKKRYALFTRRLSGAPPPFMHEFRPID